MGAVSSVTRIRIPVLAPATWVAVPIPVGAQDPLITVDSVTASFRVTSDNTDTPASQGTYVAATGGFVVEGPTLTAYTLYVAVSEVTTVVVIYAVTPPRYVLVPFYMAGDMDRPGPADPPQDLLRLPSGTTTPLHTTSFDQTVPGVLVGLWVHIYQAPGGAQLLGTVLNVDGGAQLFLAPPVNLATYQGPMPLVDTPIVTFPSQVNLTVQVTGATGGTLVAGIFGVFRQVD